jgi:hypothetical protein
VAKLLAWSVADRGHCLRYHIQGKAADLSADEEGNIYGLFTAFGRIQILCSLIASKVRTV